MTLKEFKIQRALGTLVVYIRSNNDITIHSNNGTPISDRAYRLPSAFWAPYYSDADLSVDSNLQQSILDYILDNYTSVVYSDRRWILWDYNPEAIIAFPINGSND